MPMAASEIERLIKQAMPDADVRIDDLRGDGDHYLAHVVSDAFAGKTRVQQHQMVYDALQGRMGGELHAPPGRLRNTVEIAGEIPPVGSGRDTWGVVTWEGVDPRTDRVSIYIEGLTNAYKWAESVKGKERLRQKALKLNFWRPGDRHFEHEAEIRYGIPGEVDYQWVYR